MLMPKQAALNLIIIKLPFNAFQSLFSWEDLVSPEKDCVVKVSISNISLLPLVPPVSGVVWEVLHILFVFDMEFSHLFAVGCNRVIFELC